MKYEPNNSDVLPHGITSNIFCSVFPEWERWQRPWFEWCRRQPSQSMSVIRWCHQPRGWDSQRQRFQWKVTLPDSLWMHELCASALPERVLGQSSAAAVHYLTNSVLRLAWKGIGPVFCGGSAPFHKLCGVFIVEHDFKCKAGRQVTCIGSSFLTKWSKVNFSYAAIVEFIYYLLLFDLLFAIPYLKYTIS